MGVDRRDYIIYGYKMPHGYLKTKAIDLWEDEKYLHYIEGWKDEDYCIIDDSMCGKYTVFGFLIAYGGHDGFDFLELPTEGWPTQAQPVREKFKEVFGFGDDEVGEPKVLIFSHYS